MRVKWFIAVAMFASLGLVLYGSVECKYKVSAITHFPVNATDNPLSPDHRADG
jgi:hypothetical protein